MSTMSVRSSIAPQRSSKTTAMSHDNGTRMALFHDILSRL